MAPHKLPRALDSLPIYQQPSSTTLYYSYLRVSVLIEIRLRNEAREITCVNALARVTYLASSGLATYKSPRALASLLLYQQPSEA